MPHVVIRARSVRGSVRDPFDPAVVDESSAASYWNAHRKVERFFDGWWPDEGDPLDIPSRLSRIRMYYEGEQLDRPDARPFALHRNGYAGMQRYAAFLWSGDVYSTWETLKTHVPIAINTGLTGIPLWGTDIGGFVPTKEFTGELFVRWFQFAAFCPLFRSHGRTWKLRLPWGWNTGELGPDEVRAYGDAANPGPEELHNADVEPICRKYLELRYRLMPYLYSAVREGHETGLPIIRSLWLHHPDDPAAVARGDEYLWGRDLLVVPVTEKGATSRQALSPARDLVRLLDRGEARGRPRDRPARRPGDDPPVRPGRRHHPDGPGQAVHRRARRRPDDPVPLSRRRRRIHALRGRRHHVRLSQGRLDGHRDGLGRRPTPVDAPARGRIEDAAAAGPRFRGPAGPREGDPRSASSGSRSRSGSEPRAGGIGIDAPIPPKRTPGHPPRPPKAAHPRPREETCAERPPVGAQGFSFCVLRFAFWFPS